MAAPMNADHRLSESEIEELARAFSDVTNYEADDPTTPIDPLTYREPDGDTCLHIAAWRGDLRATELLVKAGVDIDAQGDMGATPLHCAKTKEIADLLVAAGASLDIRDEFGRLPLEPGTGRAG